MNEHNSLPNIRFKSFENYWVKTKVSNLGNKFTGGGTPSKKNKSYWSGSIPWIQSSDLILNNVLKISIKKRITYKAIDESSTKLVSKDSIAIVTRVGVGKLVLIPYKYTTSQDFISISEIIYNKKFVLYLLYYVLNYSRRLGTKQGTSIKGITKNYFLATEVVLPKNSFEQQKIGDFFTKIDKLLDLQQQKIDKLELLKKALLQKLFSKHDTKIPELRFKEFKNEWEKEKLKGYIEKVSGNDGRMNLPTLTISAAKGWMNQNERFSNNIAGKEQKNYTLLKKGELSYNHGNSKLFKYGVVYELINYDEALVPKVYHSFRVNSKASARFIEYLFRGKKVDRELRKLVTSGARMDGLLNINFNNFENIQLYFPEKAEQKKIGNLLSKVDHLIELENKKLQNFQQVKKCLLQNMFVE